MELKRKDALTLSSKGTALSDAIWDNIVELGEQNVGCQGSREETQQLAEPRVSLSGTWKLWALVWKLLRKSIHGKAA